MNTSAIQTKPFAMLAAGAAAIALLALAAAPARAAVNDDEVSSVKVHFGDLDLSTGRGANDLYLRLKMAAQTVCGDEDDYVDLTELRDIQQCQQKAIESAVARIDRPVLTDLYDLNFPRQALAEGAMRVASAPQLTRASRVR